jgi:inorganic triphosphatase YgiF
VRRAPACTRVPEYEWPCSTPELDAARLATTPWRKLFGVAIAEGSLQPCFVTDFARDTLKLAFADGTSATLCIDRGEIRVARPARPGRSPPNRRASICEVEIELASGNAARLYELALALVADLPLSVATDNKAARGYALATPEKSNLAQPRKAQTIALAAELSAPDALVRIVLACLEQVAANAPGLLRDRDVEWVHQMRIGTRRLRSSLALASRFIDEPRLAPLQDELKAIAAALGEARDWDVFATADASPVPGGICERRRTGGRYRPIARGNDTAAPRCAAARPRARRLAAHSRRFCLASAHFASRCTT